jgi:hypothetical protein
VATKRDQPGATAPRRHQAASTSTSSKLSVFILHSAGQGDRGWYAYDIWESREAFQRFMDERLMPAFSEVMGDQPPPPEAAPQFYDVQVVVMPRQPAT